MKILLVKGSYNKENSNAHKLMKLYSTLIKEISPNAEITEVDTFESSHGKSFFYEMNEERLAMIKQVKESDVIFVFSSFYNFSLPITIRNWIDNISVAGETFKYSAQGPVGLMNNKFFIVSAKGGIYKNPETDHEVGYLTSVLEFLGSKNYGNDIYQGLSIKDENNNIVNDVNSMFLERKEKILTNLKKIL
jgi:FMN-dependent NADH-azoreductase